MRFITEIQVRFGDEDHAQVVYYPRFFDYFHRAFEDLFDQHAGGYRACVVDKKVGWPVVHAEADFIRPLRFGTTLKLELAVEALGRSSVTMVYRDHAENTVPSVVRGRVTVVCVRIPEFTVQPLPEPYRHLFASLLRTRPEHGSQDP